MIRGAIEVVQPTRVAGWIFSASEPLRDKTVLAFVGSRCIGAGKVDQFRQDLLDAKLGDGYCGFDFAIRLGEGEQLGAVIVRLQFSDMALIQSTSRISGADDRAAGPMRDLGAVPPGSVSWMLDRGMLDQPEYDFLRSTHAVGVYERGLRTAKRGAADDGARMEPEAVVQDLLGLFQLSEVRVVRNVAAAVSELAANPGPLRKASCPVFALWSKDRGRIVLTERSHLNNGGGPTTTVPTGGIEYSFGPDRLLFVHRDCTFAAQGTAPASGLVILTAVSAEAPGAVRKPAPARAALAS
jgi:hypothetical protein